MIEKEQREVERRPITKITHKGEIEIENQEPAKAPEAIEAEVSFLFIYLFFIKKKFFIHLCNIRQPGTSQLALFSHSFLLCSQPEPVPKATEVPEEKPLETVVKKADSPKKSVDTTNLHKSHLFDLNCKICTGKIFSFEL